MDDNKQYLLALLDRYLPVDAKEMAMRYEIINFLEHHDQPFGKQTVTGHITASAFIIDQNRNYTLMTHHFKLGKWLQLGGHTEDFGENIHESAMREAKEESGLSSLEFISEQIFDVDIHEIPKRGSEIKHLHYDIRFLLSADAEKPLVVSSESNELKWIAIDHMKDYTTSESLHRMSLKVKGMIEKK